MWRTHLIILGVLALVAGPVLLLDRYLLQPRGGPLPVDMRGAFITVYLLWLFAQIVVSTSFLMVFSTSKPLWLHVMGAPVAIALVIAGFFIYSSFESYLAGNARQGHLAARAAYADAVQLIQWRFDPAEGVPEQVRLVVNFKHSGRFSAHVEGRSADGEQVFTGEPDSQRLVHAGDRIIETLDLARYRDLPTESIEIRLYLFKDDRGSAPEDIFMVYRTDAEVRDDGKHFYAPLPLEGYGSLE